MTADQCPKPLWLDGVLYVPVLDKEILDALRWSHNLTEFSPSGYGVLRLEESSRSIVLDQGVARLTRTEFDLLARLVAAEGEAVSAERLLCDVWGNVPAKKGHDLLRTHIRNVRIKLASVGAPDTALRSVRGLGYRFRFNVDTFTDPSEDLARKRLA
jgi:DNA-binding response OmpR family regulator